ncbi:hypothetical protein T492DRAFT_914877, partial [Pavlovales sp. CCMP2436]
WFPPATAAPEKGGTVCPPPRLRASCLFLCKPAAAALAAAAAQAAAARAAAAARGRRGCRRTRTGRARALRPGAPSLSRRRAAGAPPSRLTSPDPALKAHRFFAQRRGSLPFD